MRRLSILALPLLLAAQPAHAEPGAILPDPELADRASEMARALSDAVLAIPVGELRAAAEGRAATAAERDLTIRDLGRRDDPDFDRKLDRQIAQAGPAMKAGMDALARAIPVIMRSADAIEDAVARAAANLPDPTYPRR